MGIVELGKIKENYMKEKTIKEYKQRLRLVLKSKLNGKNKITAINAWAVAVFSVNNQWKMMQLRQMMIQDSHRKQNGAHSLVNS